MKPVPPNTVIEPAMTYLLGIAQRPPARYILGLDQLVQRASIIIMLYRFYPRNYLKYELEITIYLRVQRSEVQ